MSSVKKIRKSFNYLSCFQITEDWHQHKITVNGHSQNNQKGKTA